VDSCSEKSQKKKKKSCETDKERSASGLVERSVSVLETGFPLMQCQEKAKDRTPRVFPVIQNAGYAQRGGFLMESSPSDLTPF